MPLDIKNPFNQPDKSLVELQEEDERLDAELSVLQKRELRNKLKANGLSLKHDFGGSLKRGWTWFKTH